MLAAGAKRVVTTNWHVDDEASGNLVRDFISDVKGSPNPNYAEKLREAKLELRTARDRTHWRHPFYWAGYVLIGPN